MSTVMLPCGCWISRSMFGDRPTTGYHICMYHSQLLSSMPELLFKDLWQTINDNPVPEMEPPDDSCCDHIDQGYGEISPALA